MESPGEPLSLPSHVSLWEQHETDNIWQLSSEPTIIALSKPSSQTLLCTDLQLMVSVNIKCFPCLSSHSAPADTVSHDLKPKLLMDSWLETGVIFKLNHSVNGSRWCFTRKGRWVVLVSPSSCCILAQESRTNIHKRSRKYRNNRCASKCGKENQHESRAPLYSGAVLCKYKMNEHGVETQTHGTTWTVDTTAHNWRKTSSYQFLFWQSILPPHPLLQSGLFLTLGQFLPFTHAFILLKIMCLF